MHICDRLEEIIPAEVGQSQFERIMSSHCPTYLLPRGYGWLHSFYPRVKSKNNYHISPETGGQIQYGNSDYDDDYSTTGSGYDYGSKQQHGAGRNNNRYCSTNYERRYISPAARYDVKCPDSQSLCDHRPVGTLFDDLVAQASQPLWTVRNSGSANHSIAANS